MQHRLALLFLGWLCIGAACPTSDPKGAAPDPDDTIPKWRFAGLHAPDDNNDSSYFTHIAALGKSLFVLDARGQIWEGAYGSEAWKRMEGQPAEAFFTIRILDSALYGGALRTGRIFRCDLRARQGGNRWEDIGPSGFQGRHVRSLGLLGASLVASISARDSSDTATVYRRDAGDSVWRPWNKGWPGYETAPNILM